MVTCAKCGINKNNVQRDSVTFHKFPMNPIVKAQWVAFVQKINWEPKKNSKLCSKHFEEHCFNNTSQFKRMLKSESVPTMNLLHSKDDVEIKITKPVSADCSEATVQQSNTTPENTKIFVPNLNKDKPIPKVLRKRARKTDVEENQSSFGVKVESIDSQQPTIVDRHIKIASVGSDDSMDCSENIDTKDDSVVFHALEDVYYESDSDVSCHEESYVVLKSKFNRVKIKKSLNKKIDRETNRFVMIDEKKMDKDGEKQVLLRCNEKLREKMKARSKTVRWLQKLSWQYKARIRDLLYRLDEMKDLLEDHGIVYKKRERRTKPQKATKSTQVHCSDTLDATECVS